jgi:hypothetical protein
MLPTGIGKQRTSLVVRVLVAQAALAIARVASGEPVARVGLAELAVRGELAGLAAQEALAELAVRAELAGLAAQEALAELAVRAELAGLVVQVVELELDPVEAELELDPVEGLGLVQVAVAPRTRSAIAARHRGLVPVPKRVEDLAAAAETTRAPAATEAVAAWAAAVTAAAAAVAVVEAVE